MIRRVRSVVVAALAGGVTLAGSTAVAARPYDASVRGPVPVTGNSPVAGCPYGKATSDSVSDTGAEVQPNSAIAVQRSLDGGDTWQAPVIVRADTSSDAVNDRNSLTADPTDPKRAYVIWDRAAPDRQPVLFSSTSDGGRTWSAARIIHDPPK